MCSIFGITLRLYIVIFVIIISGCAVKTSIPIQQDDAITVATPQSQNFQIALLHAATKNISDKRSASITSNHKKFTDIHSILVARNNKLVLEKYFNGAGINKAHATASVGKSIISSLIGIAIEEGYLQSDKESIYRLLKYAKLDHWSNDKASIQLRHLLTMTAGWDCGNIINYEMHCGHKMKSFDDPYRWVLDLPMNSSPGNKFNYNDAVPNLLMAIITLATQKNVAQYFHEKLMSPLEIENNLFESSKLTSREMLKIGLLYQNNGIWNGQQIIPKSWIKKSTSTHIKFSPELAVNGYGYLWWQRELTSQNKSYHTYYAAGAGGQYIIIIPSLNLVTVFTGNSQKNNQAFEILETFIIPSILDS